MELIDQLLADLPGFANQVQIGGKGDVLGSNGCVGYHPALMSRAGLSITCSIAIIAGWLIICFIGLLCGLGEGYYLFIDGVDMVHTKPLSYFHEKRRIERLRIGEAGKADEVLHVDVLADLGHCLPVDPSLFVEIR